MIDRILIGLFFLAIIACDPTDHSDKKADTPPARWQSLFNGKDLTGWTPKIKDFELGDNYRNTFRVVDSVIQVNYDQYEDFGEKFGHLFYEKPFRDYHLQLEYRFTNPQAPGGEAWAFKNSGVMFHCQAPETMGLNQAFPVSLEAQMLGGNGTQDRPTGNLCTPGLNVVMGDSLVTEHCITASAPTFTGEEWIQFDLIVYHDSLIQHRINNKTVISYSHPTIGGTHLPENYHLPEGTPIEEGYISLQSESHPIEFRNIFVKELK